MLCRCIAVEGIQKIEQQLLGAELAEIRIEETNLDSEQVKNLFSAHNNLIATCRPKKLTDEQRMVLLKAAINGGAKWLDIEIESDIYYTDELISYAKNKGCKVIISYHNYKNTPNNAELLSIIKQSINKGADLTKIATKVNEINDNSRLLSLYNTHKNILAIGMGELGIITRIAALKLGAPFTFVSVNDNCKTANGQITEPKMIELLNLLK